MSIIGGLDIHRKQLTFDYVETETGRVERGRIAPADRERLADWLTRFDTATPVAFALEGCTGWRYVVEEMGKAGVRPHPRAQCHGEERVRVMGAGARVPLVAVTGCDRVGVVVVWWWGRDTPGSGAGV